MLINWKNYVLLFIAELLNPVSFLSNYIELTLKKSSKLFILEIVNYVPIFITDLSDSKSSTCLKEYMSYVFIECNLWILFLKTPLINDRINFFNSLYYLSLKHLLTQFLPDYP